MIDYETMLALAAQVAREECGKVKMRESDFKAMLSEWRDPADRPPLIPSLVRAVEIVKEWRAAGEKVAENEREFLAEVLQREIRRQGYKGRWKPNARYLATPLRRLYILDTEKRGIIGAWWYKHFRDWYY